ncbi:MAG: hypothetical protein EBT06_13185 [Gammaproteobacteria bacterium]|nr:hypothetical protein [Gammaproteobacteria bacterium]
MIYSVFLYITRLKAPHKDLYGVPLSSTKLILHGRMLYALSNYVGPLVAQGTLEGIHVPGGHPKSPIDGHLKIPQ